MGVNATWRSKFPVLRRKDFDARRKGIIAAQQVLVNEVKTRLAGGYTSGAFVTGRALNSIFKSEPVLESGILTGRVGSPLPYVLFWEIGHMNLFTGKYERVEIWRLALMDRVDEMAHAFSRAYRRAYDGDGIPRDAKGRFL